MDSYWEVRAVLEFSWEEQGRLDLLHMKLDHLVMEVKYRKLLQLLTVIFSASYTYRVISRMT